MSARLPIVAKRRATARRRRALRRWRWERWANQAEPVTWAVAEPIIRAAEVRP